MSDLPGRTERIGWLLSLLAVACLGGGCASPSGSSGSLGATSAPKPGSGIAEYRQVTREAHKAVATTVKSLESLAQPNAQNSTTHPELAGFDRAFSQLELTSVKARARAEAIIARGQAYFDEWKGNLAAITNQAVARVETNRYARLHEHFERVRQRSGEVREEFRPFMAKLREFRAHLDKPGNATGSSGSPGSALSREELDGLTARGRRVLQTLESVSAALDEAEAELHATLAAR